MEKRLTKHYVSRRRDIVLEWVVLAIAMLIAYLLLAFGYWDYNPANWDGWARALYPAAFLIHLASFVATEGDPDKQLKKAEREIVRLDAELKELRELHRNLW